MYNVYHFLLDSNFITLNGEPESYKKKVAEYILKRIEYNKTKSEVVALLNLPFKTVSISNKNNFFDIYKLYSEEFFDFVIFEQIPQIEDIEWLKFKNFASKNNIQCIFIDQHTSRYLKSLQDLSLYAHFNSVDNSVDIVFYNQPEKPQFLINSFYI